MSNSNSKPETYYSELATKLLCPSKPKFYLEVLTTRDGLVLLVGLIALLLGIVGDLIFARLFLLDGVCGFITFFVIGAMAALPAYANLLAPVLLKQRAGYARKYAQWQRIRMLWERSYYCQRHDIVFVEDSVRAISIDDYQVFLLESQEVSLEQKAAH